MLEKAVQTGVESPELAPMSTRTFWPALVVLAFSCLSTWWLMDRKVQEQQLLDPGSFASDRFNRWEYPVDAPGSKEGEGSAAYLFASGDDTTSFIWFLQEEPMNRTTGLDKQNWGGGWLVGADLSQWHENPGEMASHWAPREPGRNRLTRLESGEIQSAHWTDEEEKRAMSTSWVRIPEAPLAPLSPFWVQWFLNLKTESNGVWQEIRVGAAPAGAGWMGNDSLMGLTDGSWLSARSAEGAFMTAVEMADSSRSIGLSGKWSDGIMILTSGKIEMLTDVQIPAADDLFADGIDRTVDFGSWNRGQLNWGKHAGPDRVIWRNESQSNALISPMLVTSGASSDPGVSVIDEELNSNVLGSVRNHRTAQSMELVWEPSAIFAKGIDGSTVWSLQVETDERPSVWEVDLYRNRKYQAVISAKNKVHVIDVLGREVKGFPKRWSQGFSAVNVFDYDRNRQYRFLMAAPNGELFNFRKEGERTPGWNFKVRPGRYITSLAHVRVSNKDYVFAGQDDGSVRFLKRSGEDRFDSPLQFPSGQIPVFRLGASIESSSVLFFDDDGVIQERTIGTNEAIGMTGLTQGIKVELQDRTGDGIPDVVVHTGRGEEVWDSRNQRIAQ